MACTGRTTTRQHQTDVGIIRDTDVAVGRQLLPGTTLITDDQDLSPSSGLYAMEPSICESHLPSEPSVSEPGAMLSQTSDYSSTMNNGSSATSARRSCDEVTDNPSSTPLSTGRLFMQQPGEIKTHPPHSISDDLLSQLAVYMSECDDSDFISQQSAVSVSDSSSLNGSAPRTASYTSSAESCEDSSISFHVTKRSTRRQTNCPAKNTATTSKVPKRMRTRRCRVDSCEADLADAMPYNKRRRICLACMTNPIIRIDSNSLRFCQQCGSLHELDQFDNGKRSCREKLRRHRFRAARLSI